MATKRPLPRDENEARPPKRLDFGDRTLVHHESGNRPAVTTLSHADYTIAWICALHLELAASRAMLDEEHTPLPAHIDDHNAYILGHVAKHNVVMVALPVVYGKVNAAAVSTNLKRSFPNITATLMVGIGGGAPGEADMRLGDVVVGTRVMEYDLGKSTSDGRFEVTAVAKFPSPLLLSVVTNLRSKYGKDEYSPYSQEVLRTRLPDYLPPTQPDRLFQASYPHPPGIKTCNDCDSSKLQPRRARGTDSFRIHHGGIASGDSVNKDAHKRDAVSREHQVLCFEMEAAGIMDRLQCLPIRGICDYSDSHKNKDWQDYAAATAASYARELLETIPSSNAVHQVLPGQDDTVPASSSPKSVDEIRQRREKIMEKLDFPRINARKDAIRSEQGRTCRWFLSHPKFQNWTGLSHQEPPCSFLLWIRGKAGAGKSTLMKFLYSEVRKRQSNASVVSFFFNARGDHLEKSIAGMYRSLLKQILTLLSKLQSVLDELEFPSNCEPECPSLNTLKDLLKSAVMTLGRHSLICFIDALDECNEDDARDMVQFFEDLTELAIDENIQFRVCFSSRPYPYIQIDEELLVELEKEAGHTEDLEKYVRKCLRVSQKMKTDLQQEILKKASGVFLWVVLVVEILNEEARYGGLALRKKLSETPPTLSELFKGILTRDQERPEELRRCVLWVLYACRPLTPGEFCHAMWAGGLEDGQVDREMPDAEDNEVSMALATSSSKGLVEVTNAKKQSTVQFIHESVRDFLIKEKGLQELWPDLGFEWEGQSHEILRSCCESYLRHPTVLAVIKRDTATGVKASNKAKSHVSDNFSVDGDTSDRPETPSPGAVPTKTYAFLEYASQRILHHADKAELVVPQRQFLFRFFDSLGTKALDCCQTIKIRRYGPTATPLYVLADQGLRNLVQTRLDDETFASVQCDTKLPFQHPLFAAMANGHGDTVVALLGLPSVIYEGENLMEGLGRRSDLEGFKSRTPVTWALRKGRIKLAEVLARSGKCLVEQDPGQRTPIQTAADVTDTHIALLLDKSASVDDANGAKAIFDALHGGHYAAANALLNRFAAWETTPKNTVSDSRPQGYRTTSRDFDDAVQTYFSDRDNSGSKVRGWMTIATGRNHLSIVKFLTDNGASINPDSVVAAAGRKHQEMVEYLVNKGAISNPGLVAAAAQNKNQELVEYLVNKGASIDSTSVAAAAQNGNQDMVEYLVNKGASIGSDAVAAAARNGNQELVEYLVTKGAIIDSGSVLTAAINGHLSVVEILANKGADLDGGSIAAAAYYGHFSVVEFLVHRGACLDSLWGGDTALTGAARKGYSKIVEFLLDRGADVNAKSFGTTAYEWAVRGGYSSTADLIKRKQEEKGRSEQEPGGTGGQ